MFKNNSVARKVISSLYKVKKGQKDKGLEKQDKDQEFSYLKDLIDYNEKYSKRLRPDDDYCRYGNIRCYEDNYVQISTPHKAINASWIHLPYEKSFISAQAPIYSTIDDFWAMCFDYNINTITMLCKLQENGKEKCVEYWNPDKRNIYISYTDKVDNIFQVKSTTEEINEDITIRTCNVLNKMTNEERKIQQINYGGWPDHEIPNNLQSVYGNVLFMFNIVDKLIGKGNPPICVHCSAGVGRTGTFIALYNLYRDILSQIKDKNKKSIAFSLMNLVRQLKEMRLHLVENFKQYELIYQIVSKLLKDRN